MNLENFRKSQTQKFILWEIPFIWYVQDKQTQRDNQQTGKWQMAVGKEKAWLLLGTRLSPHPACHTN